MQKWVAAILIFSLLSCHNNYNNPHVLISTFYGDIELELYPGKAPKTVSAFLSYIDSGFYKNSSFYRVLKAEEQPPASIRSDLIQGGMWQTNYKRAEKIPGITHESTKQTGLLHLDGTISLARTDIGTASTEFFICIGNQPEYDFGGKANPDGQGFAAFGKVIKGMDVVRRIHELPDTDGSFDTKADIYDVKKL